MNKLYTYKGIQFLHLGGLCVCLLDKFMPLKLQLNNGSPSWRLNRQTWLSVKQLKRIIAAAAMIIISLQSFSQSYHVGIGFGPYNPPISANVEVSKMITQNTFIGGQFIYRSTNAPTIAGGFMTGLLLHWNDCNYRQLSTGFYLKAEYNILTHNNDEFKANPKLPVGWGLRHYWDDWVYLDFGRCQEQWTLTLGVKFGEAIFR